MRAMSLRGYLLAGILLPVGVVIAVNALSLYSKTLEAVNTAYDRTLLASAKSIGEELDVQGFDEHAQLRARVPYSALEAFEADLQTRMYYRVSDLDGRVVSGFADLPPWHGRIPDQPPYAALVDFYDTAFRGQQVRVAVLLQPVASETGRALAVIQVAETLELRRRLTRRILFDFLWQQAALVGLIGLVVVVVVQRATRPVRRLSSELQARAEGDLTPLPAGDAPRELVPLLEATNEVMTRLATVVDNQKRFVRDSSHQLRTPLAVLKAQVQSALHGDVDPRQALQEISATVDRATVLANQMLSLAKVEQLRQEAPAQVNDLSEAVRSVALELAPLIADEDIDFDIATQPAPVHAHEWMLRELARNLLHNAVRHTPAGGTLSVRVVTDAQAAALVVSDSGPGIDAGLQARLFLPFSPGDPRTGSGLGLAICQEIVRALGGTIELQNRENGRRVAGLDATVRLPLAQNPA
jgi:two-component system, OmpR family, sensor histidine kinase TctE